MTEQDRIADAIRKMADDIQEAYRYQGGGDYAHRLRAIAALILMTRPAASFLPSSEAKQSGSPNPPDDIDEVTKLAMEW